MNIGKFDEVQAFLITSALIGALLPWLTALVNNRKMSDRTRITVAGVMAFIAACMQVLLMGKFEFTDIATAFAVIWPISQTFYRNVAMGLGVRKFENATSPESHRDTVGDNPLPTSSTAEATAAIIDVVQNAPESIAEAATDKLPDEVPEYVKEHIQKEVQRALEKLTR